MTNFRTSHARHMDYATLDEEFDPSPVERMFWQDGGMQDVVDEGAGNAYECEAQMLQGLEARGYSVTDRLETLCGAVAEWLSVSSAGSWE